MTHTALPTEREPLRLGQTTVFPRRVVEINGRELLGWVAVDGRYPQHVAGELDDARYQYQQARIPVYDGPPPPDLLDSVEDLLDALTGEEPATEETLLPRVQALQEAYEGATTARWRVASSDWRHYVTRLLQIVIPGLQHEEADALDDDSRIATLVALGVFQPKEKKPLEETQTEGAEAQSPPEKRPTSIGAKRGRGSRKSTE